MYIYRKIKKYGDVVVFLKLRQNMEPKYLLVFDYTIGALNIIELTPEELKESENEEKYDDFEDFLRTIEDKYGFSVDNANWMTTENLDTYIYKNGKEVSGGKIDDEIFKL